MSIEPLPPWNTYLKRRCFLTTGTKPLISLEECASAISIAEAFVATQGGWSTVRHYAVPTTDLNMHEVPALHTWFLELMQDRLALLLAAQFGQSELGERGSRLRVGDAFLVKYRAEGGTKHIPVHRDYSTHSLTIALNPSTDYAGGGTYFCELGGTLRPEMGHVVSFSGDLVHGGDPITHGTRYIVAAFLYVDDCAEGGHKRQRGMEIDHARLKTARAKRPTTSGFPGTATPGAPCELGGGGSPLCNEAAGTSSWLESLVGRAD